MNLILPASPGSNAPTIPSMGSRGLSCKGRFTMKRHPSHTVVLLGAALLAAAMAGGCAPAPLADNAAPPSFDAVAARSMAMKDHCLRCHGVARQKEGPSYAAIAAEYRNKPDAEGQLYKHLTSGEGPTSADPHKDTHKIVHSQSPAEIRNLVRWILAQ